MDTEQTTLTRSIDDDFKYLRDVRTQTEYEHDVITWGHAEAISSASFINTCKLNFISALIVRDTSCESTSPSAFHYDVNKVHCTPDYLIKILEKVKSLEVKHTDKNVSRIMIKKYDVDKYIKKGNVLILHVVNYGCDNARFTILTADEVAHWTCEKNDKFGGKELYLDAVSNHKYFYFNKLNAELRVVLHKKVLGVICPI